MDIVEKKIDTIKKIGNILSNLLLGETKEIIIRTDEVVKRIDRDFDIVKKNVAEMLPKVDILWEKAIAVSNSPKALNEEGHRIFNQSGIESIVLENKKMLLDAIKKENPEAAYQVEELADQAVGLLKENPDLLIRLKEGAYEAGVNVETVLFVGSIFLRDMALKELGFEVKDLEKNSEITK